MMILKMLLRLLEALIRFCETLCIFSNVWNAGCPCAAKRCAPTQSVSKHWKKESG